MKNQRYSVSRHRGRQRWSHCRTRPFTDHFWISASCHAGEYQASCDTRRGYVEVTASCRVTSIFDPPVYAGDSITEDDDGGTVVVSGSSLLGHRRTTESTILVRLPGYCHLFNQKSEASDQRYMEGFRTQLCFTFTYHVTDCL